MWGFSRHVPEDGTAVRSRSSYNIHVAHCCIVQRAQLHTRFGKDMWRGARRFGAEQGIQEDGTAKIHAIDNERGNNGNDVIRTYETIAPISVSFVAITARIFLQGCTLLCVAMVALSFGLDDIKAAYRVVPVRTPQFTVFAIWSVADARVELYYLDGHNFGFRSAVLNFNAFARLVVATARSLLAVPCDQFFDDFLIVDLLGAGDSAQRSLAFALMLLGQRHEPSKRKPSGHAHVGLGVHNDVSFCQSQLVVYAAATSDRISAVLSILCTARAANFLSPGDASSIRGKLGFIFSSSSYRFGRACMQAFSQREYFDTDYSFSAALVEAHEFLTAVLPSLRPLAMKLVRDTTPPLVVYTDAMYQWELQTCSAVRHVLRTV